MKEYPTPTPAPPSATLSVRSPGRVAAPVPMSTATAPALGLEQLLHEHHAQLQQMARRRIRRLPAWSSLSTISLVNEVFLRLQHRNRRVWPSKSIFLRDLAVAMRDISIEYMRRKQAKKRGGGYVRSGTISQLGDSDRARVPSVERLAVFEALERLRAAHPRAAEIVFLRFFCEMTMAEIAAWFDLCVRTIERHWAFARAWLEAELSA